MLRILYYIPFFFLLPFISPGQASNNNFKIEIIEKYEKALDDLKKILKNNGEFIQAVFLTEQTSYCSETNFSEFEKSISDLAEFVIYYKRIQRVRKYYQPDSVNYLSNNSIYFALFDSLIYISEDLQINPMIAYSYGEEDSLGKQDWTNMFVTKLLATRKGNCHSLVYLYKIIADKIGTKCWLALAPNHIYIKNFSQQYGWYNTELTSRSFPTDAWIMSSGYISADAVRSKIYMDTLNNQQSIGLCVLDLAKSYEYQTKNYYDGFILKCCDLALQYHATNPMALLLKAETLKKVYLKQKEENAPTMKHAYDEMETAYITLAKLHYREMPQEMYLKWMKQMQQQRN